MKIQSRYLHFINFFYYSFIEKPACRRDLLLTLGCMIFFAWLFLNLEINCLLSMLEIKLINCFKYLTYCLIIRNNLILRIFIIQVFFILSINNGSKSAKIVKQFLNLFQSPFVNIYQNRELLAESANSKHIIPWIPVTIWNNILKLALKFSCIQWVFQRCIPNIRISRFWTTNQVLAICRKSASNHLVAALRPEESFFDSSSSRGPIINQPDAVVSGLNIQLILYFGMHNDGINLVSFHFRVFYKMMVGHYHLVALNWNSPQVYLSLTISYE